MDGQVARAEDSGMSDLMRGMPLHARQAQQLFFDLLQFKSSLQPHLVETALPIRIRQLQERYLKGVQAAKRGATFSYSTADKPTASEPDQQLNQEQRVHIRMSGDGSELLLAVASSSAESITQSTTNVRLLDIEQIKLGQDGSFSLRLKSPSTLSDVPVEDFTFEASSANEATQWVITLTCGANAFQQAEKNQTSQTQTSDLVWQGVRLRIFELALDMELHQAVQIVTDRLLQDPVLRGHQEEIARLLFLVPRETE